MYTSRPIYTWKHFTQSCSHGVYFFTTSWGWPRKHVQGLPHVCVYKQRQVYKHRGSRNPISVEVTFLCLVSSCDPLAVNRPCWHKNSSICPRTCVAGLGLGGGVRLQTLQDLGDLLHEKEKTSTAMFGTVQHYPPSDRINCESRVTVFRLPVPETTVSILGQDVSYLGSDFCSFSLDSSIFLGSGMGYHKAVHERLDKSFKTQ